jgi:hypothetical protein
VQNGERRKERRQRASHPNQNQRSQKCLQTSTDKKEAFVQKKTRQLDEEALIEIERHRSIQNSSKFYKRLNDVRRPFEPQVAMCRAKNGELLANKDPVLARWKENFQEHLNEGSGSEQPTRSVDLRDDGVNIDLLRCEEIEGALKNNKAAGADSIADELLKNGGPNLMGALHEVILQAWTSETLPRSWTERVVSSVYKKGNKLDCKTYRGICLLNVT